MSEPSISIAKSAKGVTRTVQLFDRKYSGNFNAHVECVAFVKSVEVVLNHILKAKDATSVNAMLNHALEAKECGPPATQSVFSRPARSLSRGGGGGVIPVLWRPSLIWTKRHIGVGEDHEGYVLEVER